MATVGFLRDAPRVRDDEAPSVSICVAARNEAGKLEPAVRSMVQLEYPELEVVAVDDRSEDRTGRILEDLAEDDRRLEVLHVRELPEAWLGKNHALHRAAEAAGGELLLFTDADVIFEPDALARAVGHVRRHGLDHLAVAPDLEMPGPLLEAFAGSFQVYFSQFAEPWKARDPDSSRHVGVGAFNLVRGEAYRAAGGHRAIRMRPDDDMRLARILKEAGARADLLFGTGRLRVPWYETLGEAVRGLSRSAWAGLDYSPAAAAAAALFTLGLGVWPWLGALLTAGPAQALNLAAVTLSGGLYVAASLHTGSRAGLVVLWPVTGLVFVWILLRGTIGTLARGGIVWRGTFYPLEDLRGEGGRAG